MSIKTVVKKKCEKCQDRGFTEEEHGLLRVFCDCEKGKALKGEITGEIADDDTSDAPSDDTGDDLQRGDSGDRVDNQPIGSGVTREPAKSKERKAKKKAKKRSR